MPYKDGKGWRGVIKVHGKRIAQKTFRLKRDAVEWENGGRQKLKRNEKASLHGLDLLSFCSRYLIYSQRYSQKTYKEKEKVTKRILSLWGGDKIAQDISADDIQVYLDMQRDERSANASNKDRKNLLAMWNYGRKFHELQFNPVAITEKFAHDREPQYTPPTEDVLKVLAVSTGQDRVMLDCYLNTAARRSEIFRLTWVDDINFEKRQLRLGTRKTRDGSMSYEWFPMSDDLFKSLSWLWNNREIKTSPYVFVDNMPGPHYGKPYKVRRRFLKGLCESAGVQPFGFHAMRRYVASVLADNHKVSAKRIQRVLRHKNLATTERYIQNINDDLKDTLDLISLSSVPQGGTPKDKEANS
jgi:integrase